MELATGWCDLDDRVTAAMGLSVAEIFGQHGETRFRELESAAMRTALSEAPQVIAAGGGWAAHPGNLAEAESRALVVLLSVTPETAARRLGGGSGRPLLGRDPLPKLRELATARAPFYALAGVELVADAAPGTVAEGVATAARLYGGW
jgi:shikimate kinase